MSGIVAAVIGLALLGFIAIVLALIADGQRTKQAIVREFGRQIRVVSPPKEPGHDKDAQAAAGGAS